ncbi:HDOD domain-containing protein [Marinicellulosiphila megalodicopiae]|uniref:HDOD domain-containing protein n=1 Tax=Marinicellulosiphila megalodicopiae TaxID=2724896 RepID=UPI003BB0641C
MIKQWFENNKVKLLEINSPILPCVREALVMLESEDVKIDDVVSSISKDPMLCTKLLMMANSPFYGLPREVKNLQEVIVILGAYKVKSLIMTGSVDAWKGEMDTEQKKIWIHSLAVASFCQNFALKLGENDQEAYLIGLLHEVLMFKLSSIDNDYVGEINELLEYCMPKMLTLWGFPENIIQSISRFYKKQYLEGDVLPLAHCVTHSLKFFHKWDDTINIIEKENLCGKDFDFWLHDSNETVKKIISLRY